jgi:hypothetical protein
MESKQQARSKLSAYLGACFFFHFPWHTFDPEDGSSAHSSKTSVKYWIA